MYIKYVDQQVVFLILETTYKVLIQYGTLQQRSLGDDDDDDDDEFQLHMVIFGSNGQTKRMVFRKNLTGEIDQQAADVGQVCFISSKFIEFFLSKFV